MCWFSFLSLEPPSKNTYAPPLLDIMPCRRRVIFGRERLRTHGYPASIVCDHISENELWHIAGNTVSVPVFGALLAAVLKEVDFSRSHGSPPLVYRHNQGNLGESLPIYGCAAAAMHEDGEADSQWMNRLPQRHRENYHSTTPQKAFQYFVVVI